MSNELLSVTLNIPAYFQLNHLIILLNLVCSWDDNSVPVSLSTF